MLLAKGNTINYVSDGKPQSLTCTDVIEKAHLVFGTLYKFNDGTALYEIELLSNLALWNKCGGYSIEK